MRKLLRLAAAAVVIVGLAGGHAAAAAVQINLPPPISVPPLPPGTKAQSVTFSRVAANIAPGTPWLEETDLVCNRTGQTTYWKESNNRIGISTFSRVFGDQMAAVGLSGGKDATNLFEEQSTSDLQVGALITGISIKVCETLGGAFSGKLQATGTMDVEWQLYSVTKGAVVARVSTHGGYSSTSVELRNYIPVITGLFGDNVLRLAADPTFRQMITAAGAPAAAPPAAKPISFTPATAGQPIPKAAQSVVTVFAGDGWGSGIVISADGYILTNHHVAAAGDRARIRWSDGTETQGEVLRSDKRRDVALIRTAARGAPLALRQQGAQLGEGVFAIGTPLDPALQNTVTRGVVSGVRNVEGQAFIQSDVAIDHGNSGGPLLDEEGRVIGISDWGYVPDGVSHNINFFIPIDDALKVLALSPIPTVDLRQATASPRAAQRKKR